MHRHCQDSEDDNRSYSYLLVLRPPLSNAYVKSSMIGRLQHDEGKLAAAKQNTASFAIFPFRPLYEIRGLTA